MVTPVFQENTGRVDKQEVHDELERARQEFHALLAAAGEDDLRRASSGTKWNNRQLLFHMLLGYLIMRALLRLVHWFGRRPDGVSRWYASLLNAGTKPFDVVNFAGSWLGGTTMPRRWMLALFDRTIVKLHRRLDRETDADLTLGMHYPTRWDPFFRDYMTVADVYRFPTQHFDFHRAQLTLPAER
ncbi:DinB superfamily protein [Amycolatopsis tolypomycina]|uniref:DinB superfamily protein n=1 Tax=Amycolatopsis tolypomycina TaxID=208445 RepID=A0A1H5CAP5_9PSEU|nr:DinB superfamily protein [Amycolatopsis tolypomycina]